MVNQKLILPQNYLSKLDILETEIAIKLVKDCFERDLARQLGLIRVSAPLFVSPNSGLNDNLNGVERPVQFDVPSTGHEVQIVQSLAKWKRLALKTYGFKPNTGLYADMNAIRRDEELDNLHSVYVDQWDWEKVISPQQRTMETLETTVRAIYNALRSTQDNLRRAFPAIAANLAQEVLFITSQQLEDLYPSFTDKQREDAIAKKHGSVFITQIGAPLRSGKPHDSRAPDYDDWSLNGDLILWYPVLDRAVELSSMGIRVSPQTLQQQLIASGCQDRAALPFHKALLAGELPYTIGGGIGQSRMCMMLLEKAHLGEVQCSVWPDSMHDACAANGIHLL